GGVCVMHWPAMQASAPVHAMPHMPQFIALLIGSIQLWPHLIRAAPHSFAHCPAEHTSCMASHALPHAPQLLGSLIISTQLSPHWGEPPLHERTQLPLLQDSPDLHTLPHAPQLLGSSAVTVQVLPQSTVPLPQASPVLAVSPVPPPHPGA